jgi:nicotinate dehydrogenase subunit B
MNSEQDDLLERRDFIKILGPGIYFFFSIQDTLLGQQAKRGLGGGYPTDFNAYLRIGRDETITCYTGKIEMGQGIIASLAQMLAEELEAPYESISMVMGDTKLCPWDGGTNGSRSIKFFGPALRAAGAEAREVLIEMAAEKMKLKSDQVIAKNGFIIEKANIFNKISYGSLAQGKTIERHLEKKPDLKKPAQFAVCGKSLQRADALEKVLGKAQFSADIRMPKMLYGKVLKPPAHGARLKSADLSAAKEIQGAQIFQESDFIGAVHNLPDIAQKAVSLIKAHYEIPESNVDDANIHDFFVNSTARDNVIEQKGDISTGAKSAVIRVEESYCTPYVAHAPLETHSALANVENDSATIWIGTQQPFGAVNEIARTIGLAADKVRVITPYVGGGFGGKSQISQAVQAARLSKMAGVPVQVAWTREEEFFYDTFQPAAVVKISSGIDGSNQISFWDYHVYFAGDRSSQCIYDVPHLKTTSKGSGFGGGGPHPFPTGAWRGPGSNTNIFARESHIDALAAKAGMDPMEFRLKNISNERMIRVIKAAAERFGWKAAKAPSGNGHGMVCFDYLDTYAAAMAEIHVNKETGEIRVVRVVHAQDMGPVINPEGARVQIEGGIIMGLGYCLGEEIHFKGGEIKDLDFGSYRIARFSWTPQIEPVLVDNPDIASSGCGEPPIVGMGAMLANALYDATGIRLTRLPLNPERIKTKLASNKN